MSHLRSVSRGLWPQDAEALSSLYKLYDIIRKELTRLSPTPRIQSQKNETVENIALHILNGPLRSFLAKWHPKLLEWKSEQPVGTKLPDESKWADKDECRLDLEKTRKEILKDAKKLGELIGMQMLDYLFLSPTGDTKPAPPA
ncbi:MAG TPA: hypothetical protein VGN95_18060 [Pyrinomonadaceae bacterium]|nr:hypothetical protein [Pyrinomonadaceae bacterium]